MGVCRWLLTLRGRVLKASRDYVIAAPPAVKGLVRWLCAEPVASTGLIALAASASSINRRCCSVQAKTAYVDIGALGRGQMHLSLSLGNYNNPQVPTFLRVELYLPRHPGMGLCLPSATKIVFSLLFAVQRQSESHEIWQTIAAFNYKCMTFPRWKTEDVVAALFNN